MLFLVASGTRGNLTGQEISNLSRLPAFEEHTVCTILYRKAKNGFVVLRVDSFLIKPLFLFIYVLFLTRVRKRTKKKRALRQGAGFSVNHSGGINGTCVAYQPFSSANTNAMDGSARKNPPYPQSLERKNLLLRETWPCSLFPLGERAGERGLRGWELGLLLTLPFAFS